MPGILVVEDDENLNRGITFSLKKSGYEVFSAESAKCSSSLQSQTQNITEYDEQLVRRLIEKITVYEEKVTVEFKSGTSVDVRR